MRRDAQKNKRFLRSSLGGLTLIVLNYKFGVFFYFFCSRLFSSSFLDSFAAMPRVTKAQLERELKEARKEIEHLLERELKEAHDEIEQLKRRISRGHDRSRSPRRPASSSQAQMELTCKALDQVSLWQRDVVVKEQKDEIARLREEVAVNEEVIASLRRGEGPVSLVLQSIWDANNLFRGDEEHQRLMRETFSHQTKSVREFLDAMNWIIRDIGEFVRWGSISVPLGTVTRRP